MPDVMQSVVQPAPVITSTVSPAPTMSSTMAVGQGPAGPRGEPGGALALEAGATLHGHRAIAINADGLGVHADAGTLAHALSTVGITEQAATTGDTFQVTSTGSIVHSGWTWTPGPVLLGLDGVLTQTLPPGALFALQVGWGDGDTLAVRFSTPIHLGA